jgi:hypothetical protein
MRQNIPTITGDRARREPVRMRDAKPEGKVAEKAAAKEVMFISIQNRHVTNTKRHKIGIILIMDKSKHYP